MAPSQPIGEVLLRKEHISSRALQQVLKEQPAKRLRLISMLILRAELEIDDGALALSEQLGYPAALERHLERRDREIAKQLSAALCQQHACIAIGRTLGGRLIVGARDPSPALAAALESATGLTVELAVVPAILIERLVKATFSLAVEPTASEPGGQPGVHRPRSLSALYGDPTPPKPAAPPPPPPAAPVVREPTPPPSNAVPSAIPTEVPRAPSSPKGKITIPERKSGPIRAITDTPPPPAESQPILLDKPRVHPKVHQTNPGVAPAAPRGAAPVPPPKVRAATEPGEETRPERPATVATVPRVTDPARRETPTAPAPNVPIPDDAHRPDRHRQPTRPTPNVPIPEEARGDVPYEGFEVNAINPPTAPPGSVALSAIAVDAGATASDPAVVISKPAALADRPQERPRSVSEMFGDLLDEPPVALAPPLPLPAPPRDIDTDPTTVGPSKKLRPPTQPPAPPAPPAPSDPSEEPTAVRPPMRTPTQPPPPPIRTATQPMPSVRPQPPPPPPAKRPPTTPPGPPPTPPTTAKPDDITAIGGPPKRPPTTPPGPPGLPRKPTTDDVTAIGGPPKPPPAPGTGTVEASCKEIERAISRATADRVLITFAASRFKTALLLMLQDGVARGARGQGPRLQAVQTIVLPIEVPSIVQRAHDTRRIARESPTSPTQERIAELLGSASPLAAPVVIDEAVVAVLAVGDPTDVAITDDDLMRVVAAFGVAYKRLHKPK